MTNETNNETTTNELKVGATVKWNDQTWKFDGLTKKGKARLLDSEGNKKYAPVEDVEKLEPARGMASTLNRYKPGYVECVSYSGSLSQNNGDVLAKALEGKTPDEVMALAEKVLGLEAGTLVAKYESLNPGQKRMNSGNRIRAALKRGDLDEATLKAAS